MRNTFFTISKIIMLACISWSASNAQKVINISVKDGDMTPVVRAAIEGINEKDVVFNFSKGVYKFLPDFAFEKYCAVTNHENGLKRIIFPFSKFNSIVINGNGAEFIFQGQVMPFLFEHCKKVTVSDVTIDWDIPFTMQGEVMQVNAKEEWMDLRMFKEGFSWTLKNAELKYPNIGGFSYERLGNALAFDPVNKRVVHGAFDMSSHPQKVEQKKEGILRLYEKFMYYPPVGSVLNFKGTEDESRYAPAFQVRSSQNIVFNNVTIHHALGMGFLYERTENITLSHCNIYVRQGSDRVVSTTADATHFANCKGNILLENCRFEQMLDDGTNVHGTYVEVDSVINSYTIRIGLKHAQQYGFEFAGAGDEMWFIHQPDPGRAAVRRVEKVKVLNERFMDIQFTDKIPMQITKGDILENKTWNPSFTMRGCTIKNNRARNIVLKTPLKIIIENNEFSSMMSSVFLRGESVYWYESGAVADVLIKNNRFDYCAYSGMEHAVLTISPRLGKQFNDSILYDRNIRFENNNIHTFDNRIVWADRVDGLAISGNKIFQEGNMPALYPAAPVFDFTNCRNIQVENNSYTGHASDIIKADTFSRASLKVNGNFGFKNE